MRSEGRANSWFVCFVFGIGGKNKSPCTKVKESITLISENKYFPQIFNPIDKIYTSAMYLFSKMPI